MMSSERIQLRQAKHPFGKYSLTPGKGKTRSSSQETPHEARGIDAAASSAMSQGTKLSFCGAVWWDGSFLLALRTLPSAGLDPEAAAHVLRLFDLTGKYGPCTGLQRMERQATSPCLWFGLETFLCRCS